jgi:hypothetical protein
MKSSKSQIDWNIVGASIRGVSHERSGLANQDAIKYSPENGIGPHLVLAVADGHGSSKCFRSDVGASLAVSAALEVVSPLVTKELKEVSLSTIKHLIENKLALDIVKTWRLAVEQHIRDYPLQDGLTSDKPMENISLARPSSDNLFRIYGTTLLVVGISDSFVFYFQIGDGDIITVSPNGIVERPLPRDSRLMGNETTSLCLPEAWNEARVKFCSLSSGFPALILVSTDGYSNSFPNEEEFLKVGTDIFELIRLNGLDTVGKNLNLWLKEASQVASGDDITLGLTYRVNSAESTQTTDNSQDNNLQTQLPNQPGLIDYLRKIPKILHIT